MRWLSGCTEKGVPERSCLLHACGDFPALHGHLFGAAARGILERDAFSDEENGRYRCGCMLLRGIVPKAF